MISCCILELAVERFIVLTHVSWACSSLLLSLSPSNYTDMILVEMGLSHLSERAVLFLFRAPLPPKLIGMSCSYCWISEPKQIGPSDP